MKIQHILYAIASMIALAASPTAKAGLFQYTFSTPAWDTNDNPSYWGTKMDISFVVDNGGLSNINQTYSLNDLQSISLTTYGYGGAFSFVTTTILYPTQYNNVAFLSTNVDGTSATWSAYPSYTLYFDLNNSGWFNLTTTSEYNTNGTLARAGFDIYLNDGLSQNGIASNGVAQVAYWSSPSPQVDITPVDYGPAESVPEPTTTAMVGLGLFGLSAMRRRKGRIKSQATNA